MTTTDRAELLVMLRICKGLLEQITLRLGESDGQAVQVEEQAPPRPVVVEAPAQGDEADMTVPPPRPGSQAASFAGGQTLRVPVGSVLDRGQ